MSPPRSQRATAQPQVEPRSETTKFALKQDEIITAATVVLLERGLKGFTLAEVASRTGLITQGVGYYFPKKDDLAAACVLRTIARLNVLIDEAVQEATAQDRVSRFFRSFLALMARVGAGEEPPVASLGEVRALNTGNFDRVRVVLVDMFRRLRSLLETPELGWMERHSRIARTALLFQLALSVPRWVQGRIGQDYVRACERTLDIVLRGIASHEFASWTPPKLPNGWTPDERSARGSFLIAATQLINEEGYHGASVEKISARLNVSKGAFYHHNDAKDDVVARCFERTFAIITDAQIAAGLLTASNWDKLIAACQALVDVQAGARPLLRPGAALALPADARPQILRDFDLVSRRFAGMISDGIAEQSIRPIDPMIASELLLAAVNSASELSAWLKGVKPGDVASLYVRPLFVGILKP
ncbi:MAG TPA: TetR/AcrR family transcriptional regulator [Steroidobacteraceae bacterium]|nr:TetR/AcrR family transcriptional regulator [Steroidobacteraceae bacterium]